MSLLSIDDLRRKALEDLARGGPPLDPRSVVRVPRSKVDLTDTLLGPGTAFEVVAYSPPANGGSTWTVHSHLAFVDAVTGECVRLEQAAPGAEGAIEVKMAAFMPENVGELVEVALSAHARYARVVPPTSKAPAEVWLLVGDVLHLWRRMPDEFHARLDASLAKERTDQALAGRFPGRLAGIAFDRRGDGRVDLTLSATEDEDDRSDVELARRAEATMLARARLDAGGDRAPDPEKVKALDDALWIGRRPAVLLRPDPSRPTSTDGSFVGGRVRWPDHVPWPATLDGRPLTFLAQLSCADLSGLDGFPDAGVLQFFVFHEEYGADWGLAGGIPGGSRVVWHERVDPTWEFNPAPGTRRSPRGLPFDPRAPGTALLPKPSTMAENVGEASFDANNPGFEEGYGPERNALLDDGTEGHYAGGWPRTSLGLLEYGRDDVVLARFDSDETLQWGRGGTAHFVISDEDLRARRFDLARFDWDSP